MTFGRHPAIRSSGRARVLTKESIEKINFMYVFTCESESGTDQFL
uniref:Uncharacterized protein n=1 Tax=Arundo donax TaxID=35708 RepID=A0A0A9FDW9_ARUDO